MENENTVVNTDVNSEDIKKENNKSDKPVISEKETEMCDVIMGQNMDSDTVNMAEMDETMEEKTDTGKAVDVEVLHISEDESDSNVDTSDGIDLHITETKQENESLSEDSTSLVVYPDAVNTEDSSSDKEKKDDDNNDVSKGTENVLECNKKLEDNKIIDEKEDSDNLIIVDENVEICSEKEIDTEEINEEIIEQNTEIESENMPNKEGELSEQTSEIVIESKDSSETVAVANDCDDSKTTVNENDQFQRTKTEDVSLNENDVDTTPDPKQRETNTSEESDVSDNVEIVEGIDHSDNTGKQSEEMPKVNESVDLSSGINGVENTINVEKNEMDLLYDTDNPTTDNEEVAKLNMETKEEPSTTAKTEKLEAEIITLKKELECARATVKSTQGHLRDQQAKNNQMVMKLKFELYKSKSALKQQRTTGEKQLTDVVSHLVLLEGQLRKEQCRVKHEMRQRNEQIESQRNEILKLKDQNEQLLNAIKEIYAKGGMNGYMRENRRKNTNSPDTVENGGKNGKDKKVHNGKLSSVKDKFSWKNRSSLELNNFNLEKYLIKDTRMCSSHEDLQNIGKDKAKINPNGFHGNNDPRLSQGHSDDGHKRSPRNSQNFFSDMDSPNQELNKSTSESSQLSETSSGVYSLSDHDTPHHDKSLTNGYHGDGHNNNNGDDDDDDDDDDRYFSFSSTHINTVIDEEDVIGPIVSHSGQMISMGSMPMLANRHEEQGQWLHSAKNRPHSLSSVDLATIQQQALTLAHLQGSDSPTGDDVSTPPQSPSYAQNKNEMTPFQTFKTMFKRKGSKNKGHKKRSVSLSQTTNKEYSEALKKHFQKYDMS